MKSNEYFDLEAPPLKVLKSFLDRPSSFPSELGEHCRYWLVRRYHDKLLGPRFRMRVCAFIHADVKANNMLARLRLDGNSLFGPARRKWLEARYVELLKKTEEA